MKALESGWMAATIAVLLGVALWRVHLAHLHAVARACHELRGPLTAARLGLQLGCRTALSPDRLRAIDLELGRAAVALDDLAAVRLLGGVSALEDAGAPAQREFVHVEELAADSVEAWRPAALARGASIDFRWSGASALVRAEPHRLLQATGNLIANAIVHGGRRIEVRGSIEGPRARLEFADDGPGLPAPVAELARRGRRRTGRHGHGLAVASQVATAHGGRLAAAPTSGGARLVLELPLAGAGSESPTAPHRGA